MARVAKILTEYSAMECWKKGETVEPKRDNAEWQEELSVSGMVGCEWD